MQLQRLREMSVVVLRDAERTGSEEIEVIKSMPSKLLRNA